MATKRTQSSRRSSSRTSRGHAAAPLTDHDKIRRWADERGGTPSAVKGTSRGEGDPGMLRIDFPGYSGEGKLEPISWDQWFEKFEDRELALMVQDRTAGGARSNFNKLVSRSTAPSRGHRASAATRTRTTAGARTTQRKTQRTTAKRTTAKRPTRAGARTASRAHGRGRAHHASR